MKVPIRATRPGVVLLEVIVAMTIFSVGALSVLLLSAEDNDAVARAQARATEMQHASTFLNEVALWPREDLDRHLGERPQGAWLLRIDHPSPPLYTVTLRDSSVVTALLSTTLYRPVNATRP